MYDIRKLNIWKKKENETEKRNAFLQTDIQELNLSVRAFNCLKRADCHTVGDILSLLDEDGNGLRNLRNLGSRSEKEILEAVKKFKEDWPDNDKCPNPSKEDHIQEDARMIRRKQMRSELGLWETDIEAFALSQYALTRLKEKGINKVKDLYATNPNREPGWYASRDMNRKGGFSMINAVMEALPEYEELHGRAGITAGRNLRYKGYPVLYDCDFKYFVKSPKNKYQYANNVKDYYVLNGKDHFLRDKGSQWAKPTPTPTPKPSKKSTSGGSSRHYIFDYDDVHNYDDPEDWWEDHEDEFEDFEDAWDYWEENQ